MINQIIVGNPDYTMVDGIQAIQCPVNLYPSEIRMWAHNIIESESEYILFTKNPTVLSAFYYDMRDQEDSDWFYGFVYFKNSKTGQLTRLLDVRDSMWLCLFDLGELFAYSEFDEYLGLI